MATIQPIFYKMRDLPNVVGLSRSEIYRQVSKGTFPKPISLGGANKAWHVKDLQAWAAKMYPEAYPEAL